MSHLSLPRIHFQGEMWADVTTANNDDVVKFIDVATVTLTMPDGLTTTDDFRRWATELDPEKQKLRASWNYYGTTRCWFDNVSVKGVQLPGGELITSQSSEPDPLIGAAVNLNRAVMIDVDPESILSSQIFCDQFQIRSGDGLRCQGPPTRFYSRWNHSWRNLTFRGHFKGASAVWQAAIPPNQLRLEGTNSPVLNALREVAEAGQGLFIRFCTYFFQYDLDQDELAQRFANGDMVVNPAHGKIVGTIGPWQPPEMASVLSHRLLLPSNLLLHNGGYWLGPAVAQVDQERSKIVLDLITTFPEQDETLEKLDQGVVSLQLRYRDNDDTKTEVLGLVSYDRTTYETGGGIVELEYPAALAPHLDAGELRLFFEKTGFHTLRETDLTIETDKSGLYFQEGGSQSIQIQVFKKGRPPQEPTRIKLQQYIMTNINKDDPASRPVPAKPASPDQYIIEMPDEIQVAPGGRVELSLTAKAPGTCIIRFVNADRPASRFKSTFTTGFFINIRIFPTDNYDDIDDTQLSFDFIYQHVLRYYDLLYPAMTLIPGWAPLDFSDEDSVRRHVHQIKARISEDIWHTSAYMPITRDLSDGKRKLLERWCDLVISSDHT